MNKYSHNFFDGLVVMLWNMFWLGGCAYLIFWKGFSGWWFVLAILIASSARVGKFKGDWDDNKKEDEKK